MLVATKKSEQNKAVLDPWSVVHLGAGMAAGLVGLSFGLSMTGAIGYEVVEQAMERKGSEFFGTSNPESLANATADVAIFAVGHWLGKKWRNS